MLRPTVLLCLVALFPILSCITIIPRRAGIIGLTAADANVTSPFNMSEVDSGCRWFGRAPFCGGECPEGWTEYRSGASRYPKFSLVSIFEETFGQPCLTSKKVYCCFANVEDSTWSGKWISSKSGNRRECSYEAEQDKMYVRGWPNQGYCGSLNCKELDGDLDGNTTTVYDITGYACKTIENVIGNYTGTAGNGTIEWKSGEVEVDRWYKYEHLDQSDWDVELEQNSTVTGSSNA